MSPCVKLSENQSYVHSFCVVLVNLSTSSYKKICVQPNENLTYCFSTAVFDWIECIFSFWSIDVTDICCHMFLWVHAVSFYAIWEKLGLVHETAIVGWWGNGFPRWGMRTWKLMTDWVWGCCKIPNSPFVFYFLCDQA